jgi:hypothetical protein
MRKMLIFVLASVLLFLAGCQATTPESVPTSTPIPPTPTIEPTVEVVVEEDHCVSCHTDKEQLISVAEPEEDSESESSGVG